MPDNLEAHVELLTDRLEVMAQNFMNAVNEATMAKAEIRRLNRMVIALQEQNTKLLDKDKTDAKPDPDQN